MSPDFAARRLICAAYAYYVLDEPLMSDSEYDKLSRFVAGHWDELEQDRQWALDTPEATRSSGAHIYFSPIAVAATYAELARRNIKTEHAFPAQFKRTRKGRQYVTARAS